MEKPVYTVVLDKLVLLLNGTIPQIDNLQQSGNNISDCKLSDLVILKKNNKHKHPSFYNCYDVQINSKLFGQLFCNYSGKYRYSVSTPLILQVENYVLYADGLADKINLLLQSLSDVHFSSYQNIDIAVDSHELVKKHEIYLKSKQYKRQANIKNITIIYDEKNNKQVGYTIGSKQSDKHIGIYNKQAEIVFSGKNYISEFWNNNGLYQTAGKSIDRIEGRLSGKELIAFSNKFEDLENTAYLLGFFKLMFENYLLFCNTKNKKARRHLINWHQLDSVKIKKEQTTVNTNFSTYKKKITLHTLFDDFLCTGDINTLTTFLKFVRQYNLVDWALRKTSHWFRDLRF